MGSLRIAIVGLNLKFVNFIKTAHTPIHVSRRLGPKPVPVRRKQLRDIQPNPSLVKVKHEYKTNPIRSPEMTKNQDKVNPH